MRLSCCQRHLQLLFAIGAAVIVFPALSKADSVTLKNNKRQEGTVVGVQGSSVMIQVGSGRLGFPVGQIKRIDMPVPAEFAKAEEVFAARDYEAALVLLKPLVRKFKGLPLDWARKATRMLGDTYLGMNDLPRAKETFADFQKAYPREVAVGGVDVSVAKLAVANKEYPKALETLKPLAETALSAETFTQAEGETYGLVFVLLGDIDRAEGRFSEALENYLRTVTIFYHDEAVAAEARQKADALREAHPDVHTP